MGGGSGGGLSSSDIKALEERARQKLVDAKDNASRHVFISFDHEDMDRVNLLRGQVKNVNTDLQFDDYSVKDPFDSANADYIKRKIREKIDHCSVTMVYLSEKTAASNWVNWEIEESIKRGKGVIGVYSGDKCPEKLPASFKQNNCKAVKWEHAILVSAIENASTKR